MTDNHSDTFSDIRSLMPFTLRLGTDPAVGALAAIVEVGERPVSLVSGHLEGQPVGNRTHLLLLTDRGFSVASLKGGAARKWAWEQVDTFSTRNSNPASYALDFVALGLFKSMSCMFVFRLSDGERLTFSNVRPERRGFTVGRRIAWYTRRGKLSASLAGRSEAALKAAKLAGGFGNRLKDKAQTAAQAVGEHRGSVPDDDGGNDVRDDSLTPDDVLAHLSALYDAGVISEAELRRKAAEAGIDLGAPDAPPK